MVESLNQLKKEKKRDLKLDSKIKQKKSKILDLEALLGDGNEAQKDKNEDVKSFLKNYESRKR